MLRASPLTPETRSTQGATSPVAPPTRTPSPCLGLSDCFQVCSLPKNTSTPSPGDKRGLARFLVISRLS